ncbi:MAG: M24 family metallopeptidase [Candidatus Kerfeldbacteria bacterium]
MKTQTVIRGTVIHGEGVGRKLGYPTANLDQRYFRENPQKKGVFAARTWIGSRLHRALAIIGVPGRRRPSGKVEVYIPRFSGNLYGKTLTAELIERIRPLRRYKSIALLKKRIAEDERIALLKLRIVEQEEEVKIRSIRRGVEVVAQRFKDVRSMLRVGRSEVEIVKNLSSIFRSFPTSFPTIIASGPNGAHMHHVPTSRKLRYGDTVIVDFGIVVDGFCTDLSRTFFLGKPNTMQRRIYGAVLSANKRGLHALVPFVSCRSIDGLVRSELKRRNLGHLFIHGSGHGVGRKIHEPPTLGPRSVDLLLPGNVVTIEPGVYRKGWGGVRIEDMALVTENGIDVLTKKIPKNLKDMVV